MKMSRATGFHAGSSTLTIAAKASCPLPSLQRGGQKAFLCHLMPASRSAIDHVARISTHTFLCVGKGNAPVLPHDKDSIEVIEAIVAEIEKRPEQPQNV